MFITWSFMEINMLIFIPILRIRKMFYDSQILGLKYFFIQSLASIILFFRMMLMFLLNRQVYIYLFISLSLCWKIGIPPFHLWLFNLMIEIDWILFFLTSSWQKILPLYLMRQIYFYLSEFYIVLALIVSVFISIFQSNVKKILIISSIFTGAWVLSSIFFVKIFWILILFLYSGILFICVSIFSKNKFLLKSRNNLISIQQFEKINILFVLFSMAGLPPFLGFYIKVRILIIIILRRKFLLSILLVLRSVALIYIYLRIFLNRLIFQDISNKTFLNFIDRKSWLLILFIYILSPLLFFS